MDRNTAALRCSVPAAFLVGRCCCTGRTAGTGSAAAVADLVDRGYCMGSKVLDRAIERARGKLQTRVLAGSLAVWAKGTPADHAVADRLGLLAADTHHLGSFCRVSGRDCCVFTA